MSGTQDMGVGGEAVVRIESLAAGGRGVARPDGSQGRVWFVDGGLPGDVVRARVIRVARRHVESVARTLEAPSPRRREPPCPIQATCGGCPWMPLDEVEQRRERVAVLDDALRRIGRLADPPVAEPVPCAPVLGYRNRIELTLGRDPAGRTVLGMHARGGGLVDVPACAVAAPSLGPVLEAVRAEVLGDDGPASSDGGSVRVVLRRGADAAGTMVVVRTAGARWPGARRAARRLAARPDVGGVVQIEGRPGRRGGGRVVRLAGAAAVRERVAGFDLEVPAGTFVQVHPDGAERLVEAVRTAAGDVEGLRVANLYGGVGVYGMALRRAGAAAVTVVDADPAAIAAGRRAVRRNGLDGVVHVRDDVARALAAAGDDAPDVVVANPPRAGLAGGVAAAIARVGPPRLVLVSCEPTGLARDLRTFADAGYRIDRLVPVDQFPQTAHLEVVATLSRPGRPRPRPAPSRRRASG